MLDESDLFFEFLAPPGLSQAPVNHDVNQTEKRTSPDTDSDVEDDGYTLTAYGDISLSNVLFVPGLPTALSPERHTRRESRDSHYRDNNNHMPAVIRKVLPPSSSKPSILSLKSDADFQTLVQNLKDSHRSSSPRKATQSERDQHLHIYAPQPRHVINLNLVGGDAANESRESHRTAQVNAAITGKKIVRAVQHQDHKSEVVPPKPKEKPLRGNAKLPSRPPIPRWDLLDPDYTGETTVVYRGLGSRLKM